MIFFLHAVTMHAVILKPVTCSAPSRLENIISTSLRSDNLLGPERIKSAILTGLKGKGQERTAWWRFMKGRLSGPEDRMQASQRGLQRIYWSLSGHQRWGKQQRTLRKKLREPQDVSGSGEKIHGGQLIPTEHKFWPDQWLWGSPGKLGMMLKTKGHCYPRNTKRPPC